MAAMTDGPLARFDRAAAVADRVIAAVEPDQLELPSPCTEWSVRQVINHVVLGSLRFATMVGGGGTAAALDQDHLGADPLGAFRDAVRGLRAAFSADGVLDRTYPTPFGEGPGSLLVTMRVVEMSVHAWDIAKATGQSTDLDPELAESNLSALRTALPADRDRTPFGTPRSAPADATAADRLAAFMGRTV
jgi:uncharacterized protein (TIGR03086 family)